MTMGETERVVVIYGAGGHGKVVLDALRRAGREVVGFVDDDPERAGGSHCGLPVFGGLGSHGVLGGVDFVVAIGDAEGRRRGERRVEEMDFELTTAVHPSAVIAPGALVAPGAMILAAAVLNPGVRVGRCAIVNTGAIIDHDTVVGDYAHVAPGASLAGNVYVGAGALIGVGASVVPGIRVGAEATVGAGAVVVADVEPGATVVGVPARPRPADPARRREEGDG